MSNRIVSVVFTPKYWIISIAYILIIPCVYSDAPYGNTVHAALSGKPTQKITSHTLNNANQSSTDYDHVANTAHLLGSVHYDTNQQQHAQATILALANTINPLATIDFNRLSQLKGEEVKRTLDNNRPYIGLVRLYHAIQNLGLANLHTIYHQRMAPKGHTQSPLEQDNIRALRRTQVPAWKAQLKNVDDVVELQRQTLELMADQLAETHKTRMVLERLLATTSASLLQTNTLLRRPIEEQAKQAVGKYKSVESKC